MDKFLEMEYKFAADHVDPVKFDEALRLLLPDEAVAVVVTDTYYCDTEGGDPARHRVVGGGYQELTVKARRKLDSLRERTEINIKIDEDTADEDIEKFMYMLGYDRQMTLHKPDCAVYTFANLDSEVEVALYQVFLRTGGAPSGPRTFCEVEVKGELPESEALELLNEWKEFLQETFKLGEPMNKSLYEMYSPKENA